MKRVAKNRSLTWYDVRSPGWTIELSYTADREEGIDRTPRQDGPGVKLSERHFFGYGPDMGASHIVLVSWWAKQNLDAICLMPSPVGA